MQLLAHHGADEAALYNGSKPITVTGTIARVWWVNPHTFIEVDVKDASGRVTQWRLEFASPNTLARQGWTQESMKRGDPITVTGTPAKDGSPTAYVRSGTLANGTKMIDTSRFVPDGATIRFPKPAN